MKKMYFPPHLSPSLSHNGMLLKADEDGAVEVPDEAVADLKGHGLSLEPFGPPPSKKPVVVKPQPAPAPPAVDDGTVAGGEAAEADAPAAAPKPAAAKKTVAAKKVTTRPKMKSR